MAMNSLKDIYLDQLQDIWSANTQSLPVVTELGRAAQDKELQEIAECTFHPKTHRAPEYIARIAKSMKAARDAKGDSPVSRPDWR